MALSRLNCGGGDGVCVCVWGKGVCCDGVCVVMVCVCVCAVINGGRVYVVMCDSCLHWMLSSEWSP